MRERERETHTHKKPSSPCICRKRSLTNEQPLLQALRGALPAPLEVRRYVGSDRLTLAATAQLFSRAALLTGPHGGAFLNMIYCAAGTPIVEIGYARARPHAPPTDTDYYSYFHTMARRLDLPFWVVLGQGSYTSPIAAPVADVVATVRAALAGARRNRPRS